MKYTPILQTAELKGFPKVFEVGGRISYTKRQAEVDAERQLRVAQREEKDPKKAAKLQAPVINEITLAQLRKLAAKEEKDAPAAITSNDQETIDHINGLHRSALAEN